MKLDITPPKASQKEGYDVSIGTYVYYWRNDIKHLLLKSYSGYISLTNPYCTFTTEISDDALLELVPTDTIITITI